MIEKHTKRTFLQALKPFGLIFFLGVILKTIFLLTAASNLQDVFYVPFIKHFLTTWQNPWDYFYNSDVTMRFPYPPLLLYILAFFYWPFHALGIDSTVISNLFFKLPLLLSDFFIFFLLCKMFPHKLKEVIIFYFFSPIILYAGYIYAQLDMIPVAFLLFSLFLLMRQRWFLSSVMLGLAMSTKVPSAVALPLMLIYLWRNHSKKYIWYFLIIPVLIYLFFVFPYFQSMGYRAMVLNNQEQYQVFSLFVSIGTLKIYLIPLAILLIYVKFFLYPKVNQDLLFSFLGLLFSLFIVLIPPMPNWYVWMVPFVSIFLIRQDLRNRGVLWLNVILCGAYLVYFFLFFNGNRFYPAYLYNLQFVEYPFHFTINNEIWRNLSFSVLEGVLIVMIYALYKFGVKSNSIYKEKNQPFIIGIGGDSSTGKSTLLSDLQSLLGRDAVLALEGDGNHKWERDNENWKLYSHLNPKANYLYKQVEDIAALKNGKSIEIVEYDHQKGSFSDEKIVSPRNYVIICGLHPFYLPKMRKIIDLKIYMDTDEDLRRQWKLQRDTKERGYQLDKVIKQITQRLNDAKKHIIPQKEFADVTIRYFIDEGSKTSKTEQKNKFKLKATIDSSIHIDYLIEALRQRRIPFMHDYAMDLKTQYLILEEELPAEFLKELVKAMIPNVHEISKREIIWQNGLRGFVQFLVLLNITEKLKEAVDHDV